MIVTVNASINELSNQSADTIEEFFTELLRASRKGYHFVILNRMICDWAENNLDLSRRDKAQLGFLKGEYTQTGALLNRSPCVLEIVAGRKPLEQHMGHRYSIGHENILNTRHLSEARLLLENAENDGRLIKEIFNGLSRAFVIKDHRYQTMNGGGSTISACFKNDIDENRVVVCLVDSDKYAPTDKTSSTYKSLDRVSKRQTYVGDLYQTECREAENIIPLYVYNNHNLCPDFNDFEKLSALLEKQELNSPGDDLWLFFDVKKGLEPDKLNAVSKDCAKAWVQNKYLEDGESFTDIELGGFGDAILSQFLDCNAAIRDFVKNMDAPLWHSQFFEFFETIYWFFVSHKPKATY